MFTFQLHIATATASVAGAAVDHDEISHHPTGWLRFFFSLMFTKRESLPRPRPLHAHTES